MTWAIGASSMTSSNYHEIVRISEEEMWQLRHDNGNKRETGVPRYYAIMANGLVRFFPELPDPMRFQLVCAVS
jgi:hypothetical protein